MINFLNRDDDLCSVLDARGKLLALLKNASVTNLTFQRLRNCSEIHKSSNHWMSFEVSNKRKRRVALASSTFASQWSLAMEQYSSWEIHTTCLVFSLHFTFTCRRCFADLCTAERRVSLSFLNDISLCMVPRHGLVTTVLPCSWHWFFPFFVKPLQC